MKTNEYRSEVLQRMDIDNLLDLLTTHFKHSDCVTSEKDYKEFNKRCMEDIKNEIKRRVNQ
ncbi:hypothetical protein 000TH008_265 [Bacillus phage 000TH008]|nr:hypothetical protein 000TH008_7 [Bacillus phage 000TH008]QQO40693.1 hypothetical protein 000TH008_265 [Bacillus phage 000TH008]QQO40701.1 hypothetical protein 000TH009_7 [Bacillus phage 000TH009]QQO40958.1 hypothetical protein 000TH009_265 [Bacillus phage 000TH009]